VGEEQPAANIVFFADALELRVDRCRRRGCPRHLRRRRCWLSSPAISRIRLLTMSALIGMPALSGGCPSDCSCTSPPWPRSTSRWCCSSTTSASPTAGPAGTSCWWRWATSRLCPHRAAL